MRRAGGYAVVFSPAPTSLRLDDPNSRPQPIGEGSAEYDTYTCGHCGGVRHVRPRERPEDTGGLCKQCMKLICPHCLRSGRCDPLEKKLEEAERRALALRSYGV